MRRRVTISVPDDVHSKIRESATAQGMSMSAWLERMLIEDLAAPDNGLPRELRAQIVSIGIWILRELERIRGDDKANFGDLIEVSRAIRKGLL